MPDNKPAYWLPVEHNMLRRNQHNNYHVGHKAYMVTLRVEGMTPLLGRVEASTDPEKVAECHLTALGETMRQAWLTLPQRFPNIAIHDSAEEYVIMPEHFHGILYVTGYMEEHLSDIVRLLKARVAMSYRQQLIEGTCTPVGTATAWQQAYRALPAEEQAKVRQWVESQRDALYSATGRRTLQSGAAQPAAQPPLKVVASGSHGKTGFLFATGYTDSLLLDEENLQGHRLYILNNPQSRWQRSHNRTMLSANRAGIDTAVTITALEAYLRRECPPRDVTEEKLAIVRSLLLCSATSRRVECQSYGDRALLQRRLLPVVCHRKDNTLFAQQKARCLREAAEGTVLVSACISPREREIMQAAMDAGYPVVRIEDNGFPELYHPSQSRIDLCAAQRLLIVTPWQYHYRHKDEAIFVAYCKTMNAIAQALCRTKDSWWKDNLFRD